VVEMLFDRRAGVIREEHDTLACLSETSHRVGGTGDRAVSQPDHPVQIEEPCHRCSLAGGESCSTRPARR
jgi:hypothetical protein